MYKIPLAVSVWTPPPLPLTHTHRLLSHSLVFPLSLSLSNMHTQYSHLFILYCHPFCPRRDRYCTTHYECSVVVMVFSKGGNQYLFSQGNDSFFLALSFYPFILAEGLYSSSVVLIFPSCLSVSFSHLLHPFFLIYFLFFLSSLALCPPFRPLLPLLFHLFSRSHFPFLSSCVHVLCECMCGKNPASGLHRLFHVRTSGDIKGPQRSLSVCIRQLSPSLHTQEATRRSLLRVFTHGLVCWENNMPVQAASDHAHTYTRP